MKIAFAGTPRFGALALGALLDSGHDVAVVFTQPDRPAGRGQKPRASAVKELAVKEGLMVEQPADISSPEVISLLGSLGVKALTIAAFGQILKGNLLKAIPCINVHASLLPRYRGAAPIERAIMDCEGVTGVSIMEVLPALDTGPVYRQDAVVIGKEDDAGSMYEKLGRTGGEALAEVLSDIEAGRANADPQDGAAATYAEKITPADMRLDFNDPAWRLACRVRGLSPHIGAFTEADGQRLKVWRAVVAEGGGNPGSVIIDGERLLVACGTGTLEFLDVQPQGKRRMSAAEFLRGYRKIVAGKRLGA